MEEEQKISSDQVALAFAKAYYYQLHEGADSMSRFYMKDAVSTYGYLEKPIYTDEKAPCQKKKIQGVEEIKKRWSSVPSKAISSDIKVACGEPLGDDSVLVHIQGILQTSKTAKRKSFQHNVVLKSWNGRFMIQTEIFLLETPDENDVLVKEGVVKVAPKTEEAIPEMKFAASTDAVDAKETKDVPAEKGEEKVAAVPEEPQAMKEVEALEEKEEKQETLAETEEKPSSSEKEKTSVAPSVEKKQEKRASSTKAKESGPGKKPQVKSYASAALSTPSEQPVVVPPPAKPVAKPEEPKHPAREGSAPRGERERERDRDRDQFSVFVGSVVHEMTEEDIHNAMKKFGEVRRVQRVAEKDFAFVSFATKEAMIKAIKEKSAPCGEHNLTIEERRPKKGPRTSRKGGRPRRGGPGGPGGPGGNGGGGER
eukprot:TRINITY_DN1114_c0_g1_i1.p1 TRINITY_DN1114_c0_g1~~TRINITY_DN1114_c0_g1_i1.p1  ORF type:complete len:425 (+),score=136.34 TRINITY_DN1114_c0_g1_i1:313-1587(+)